MLTITENDNKVSKFGHLIEKTKQQQRCVENPGEKTTKKVLIIRFHRYCVQLMKFTFMNKAANNVFFGLPQSMLACTIFAQLVHILRSPLHSL